jgi:hypothetical protein
VWATAVPTDDHHMLIRMITVSASILPQLRRRLLLLTFLY